jgi:hypothetical protein
VGPAGTGKTFGILTVLHCLLADYPGLRFLICRKTRASLTESALVTYEQQILPADGMEGIARGCGRANRRSYVYPNGSELVTGGLDRPAKIFSTDWDLIYPNEAIDFTEEDWETLSSRLARPGRAPWLGYLLGDTNPGDPGHWLKRRAEKGQTELWDTTHRANPRLYHRGKITAEGLVYDAQLERLTGSRKKRLKHGLWAAGEGAWFDGFDGDTHVTTAAEYDPHFPAYLALDSGPHSGAVWIQYREPGVCVFEDYYSFNRGAFQVARDCIEATHARCGGRLDSACTDPAGNSSTAIGITVFQEYARAGLKIHAWPMRSVLDSLALVESFVSVSPPELLVHPRCKHLINAFANYKRARRAGQFTERPEDPQHPYEDLLDALRGALCDKFPDGRKLPTLFSRERAGRVF